MLIVIFDAINIFYLDIQIEVIMTFLEYGDATLIKQSYKARLKLKERERISSLTSLKGYHVTSNS